MAGVRKQLEKRLKLLEQRLQQENPLLKDAVRSFRKLDRVAYRLGLLAPGESYATQISWWPLVSVLGTFSAGKSTFINHFLGASLQATGNQAVDDKFTVICYSAEDEPRTLPGIALDADPRFPFYQMSEELEKVAKGEGANVDAYLQMKTCHSDELCGKILIDSPGFDADAQRTSTLRMTDYIIGLSDLVLVFFDARRPEPGAMQDTLTHLVAETIGRRDSIKFLYILNQIDTTAREDNPEEVVGSWQRAIAHEGLTAGKFYTIYNPDAAVPIENEALRERFESKRNVELDEIHDRIRKVSVERAYRIIAELEKTCHEIEEHKVPRLRQLMARWGRGVLWRDLLLAVVVLGGLLAASVAAGYWNGLQFSAPWLEMLLASPRRIAVTALGVVLAAAGLHFIARAWSASSVMRYIRRTMTPGIEREGYLRALRKNTRFWRSIFEANPAGWTKRTRRQLMTLVAEADRFVQSLNDRFADPSGRRAEETQQASFAVNDDEMVESARNETTAETSTA